MAFSVPVQRSPPHPHFFLPRERWCIPITMWAEHRRSWASLLLTSLDTRIDASACQCEFESCQALYTDLVILLREHLPIHKYTRHMHLHTHTHTQHTYTHLHTHTHTYTHTDTHTYAHTHTDTHTHIYTHRHTHRHTHTHTHN